MIHSHPSILPRDIFTGQEEDPPRPKTSSIPLFKRTNQNPVKQLSPYQTFYRNRGKKAMNGGLPGAIAGVIQVLTLMWLRTVVNYQCRYGAPFKQSLSILYKDGGVRRFYRGLPFAIVQAPLSKFVATAANEGVHSLLGSLNFSSGWGAGRVTIVASVVVGVWRIFLMPIDTCKTVLQVDSNEGFRNLIAKVKAGNIEVLYSGESVK